MYDYNNGRFLSVDPFIQAPTSTQSLNPYTYIFNNPLSGTDPTGYLTELQNEALTASIEKFEGVSNQEAIAKSGAIQSVALISAVIFVDSASDVVAPIKGLIKKGVKGSIQFAVKNGKDIAKTVSDKFKSISNTKSSSSRLKNSDKIKEGNQFEKDELQKSIDSGENVTGNNRLVPQNGNGNVNGNRTNTDQLIKNEDGTFKIVETKLTSNTPLSKGQKGAQKQVNDGDGIFETRTNQPSQGLKRGDRIKVTVFEKRVKRDVSSGASTSVSSGKTLGSNIPDEFKTKKK